MAEEKMGGEHADSKHLKLVSEGGGDASTRRAQCWSPDQIVASCITSQQMENFRAYNNVCMTLPTNDMYVFSLPLEHAGELDQGEIPHAVRQEFETNGSTLSPAARVNVQQSGRVWFIIDLDRKYSIRMVPTGLLVYSERL
ncbi:hypothetical protein KP004_19505 [Geomonas oryzisoli]|uniref:Uncharacterized protein n=1 Tax=Geomonas oryzisoli TaxID=2847992 RepID=A0ABX8J4F9_9BACT|nr:hypothetical protein [Geomonas oryzisoli]QWV93325.1 hypothetical protein KP004_19505 [Geomonas oryzisoli]